MLGIAVDPVKHCTVLRETRKFGFLVTFSAEIWGWPVASKELVSPDMTDDEGRKWRLKIRRGNPSVSCALACDTVVTAFYSVTMYRQAGYPAFMPYTVTFDSVTQLPTYPDWKTIITTAEVISHYCSPTGEVAFHLEILPGHFNPFQPHNPAPPVAPPAKTISLCLNPEYADMTIIVQGERLPAHKCILCPRSVVFHAMFEHPMQEASTNEVQVGGAYSAAAIKAMLHFLYADMIPEAEVQEMAPQLISLASYYQIPDLRVYVENTVILEDDLIHNLLQSAVQHDGSKHFLTTILKYVLDNKEHLMQEGFLDSVEGKMLLLTLKDHL